mmetsp:Transcript_65817/g.116646  ORF Transcript_65817/g.116646 Transcript_65817/m.116646 type:complete len:317 (+) Transcript_65817:2576-3526(+)
MTTTWSCWSISPNGPRMASTGSLPRNLGSRGSSAAEVVLKSRQTGSGGVAGVAVSETVFLPTGADAFSILLRASRLAWLLTRIFRLFSTFSAPSLMSSKLMTELRPSQDLLWAALRCSHVSSQCSGLCGSLPATRICHLRFLRKCCAARANATLLSYSAEGPKTSLSKHLHEIAAIHALPHGLKVQRRTSVSLLLRTSITSTVCKAAVRGSANSPSVGRTSAHCLSSFRGSVAISSCSKACITANSLAASSDSANPVPATKPQPMSQAAKANMPLPHISLQRYATSLRMPLSFKVASLAAVLAFGSRLSARRGCIS